MNFISKEKELRMIWEVEREGRKSRLAGTAHFFPYGFKNSLSKHIGSADVVLLEGPLDESAMSRIVEQGSGGKEFPSLYDALNAQTIVKINRELAYPSSHLSTFASYVDIFKSPADPLHHQIKGQRPWMAFFSIWFQYLRKRGWKYTMDLDAFKTAERLGKKIHHLEKIEEQIEALDGIPLEKIVNFLKKIEQWEKYTHGYVKRYLSGGLEELMSAATEFPTRCESIIDRRDPVLYERMKVFLEKGNAIAFVGITHIQGIKKMLVEDGYKVTQSLH